MRIRTPLLAAAAAATMLAGAALPASAAPVDTVTTFTLTSGGLGVAPAATVSLNDDGAATGLTMTHGAHDVYGSLGAVTVDDARGGGATTGWTVTAVSTAFDIVEPVTGSASTAVTYTDGTISATGVTTTTSPGSAVTLTSTPANVVLGTSAVGSNTATWTPHLTVSMPATAHAAVVYTGTVGTSVN